MYQNRSIIYIILLQSSVSSLSQDFSRTKNEFFQSKIYSVLSDQLSRTSKVFDCQRRGKYVSITFLVHVKIPLNEKKPQHLCQHFQSELVKWILYGHRKFESEHCVTNIHLAISSLSKLNKTKRFLLICVTKHCCKNLLARNPMMLLTQQGMTILRNLGKTGSYCIIV